MAIEFSLTKTGFSLFRKRSLEGKTSKKKIGEIPFGSEIEGSAVYGLLSDSEKPEVQANFRELKRRLLYALLPFPVPGPSKPRKILILTEGETERVYINGLINQFHVGRAVKARKAVHNTPWLIVQEGALAKYWALEEEKELFEVWTVFDRDGHPDFAKALELAAKYGIHTCVSIPSVEVWFLEHFIEPSKARERAEALAAERKEQGRKQFSEPSKCLWELKQFLPNYIKADEQLARKLKPRLREALQRETFKRPDKEWGSEFPRLIGRLEKFGKEINSWLEFHPVPPPPTEEEMTEEHNQIAMLYSGFEKSVPLAKEIMAGINRIFYSRPCPIPQGRAEQLKRSFAPTFARLKSIQKNFQEKGFSRNFPPPLKELKKKRHDLKKQFLDFLAVIRTESLKKGVPQSLILLWRKADSIRELLGISL